jgi:MFS transporter, DHA1 family, multidrug resistance protein
MKGLRILKVDMFHKNYFSMLLLMPLILLPMLATDIYLPAMSSMGQEFKSDYAHLMLTLTTYMVGYSLSLLFSGVLADRYGRRPIVLFGVAIFIFSSMACYFSSSVEALTIGRFFQALGGGCGTLLARVIVRDFYDLESQVKVLSYLAAGLVLSPILGPLFGGYLVTYYGWRSIFLALSIFASIVLVFLLAYLEESMPRVVKKSSDSISSTLYRYLRLLTYYEFQFHTLVISFAWAVYFSFVSSSPGLLQGFHGLTPVEYGYVFSTTLGGYILGTIFIRRKIGLIPIKDLIFIAGLVMLASTSCLLMLSILGIYNLPILLVFILTSLFGVGVIFPATQAGVTSSFNRDIGLISGLFYSIEMLFGAICSYILSNASGVTWLTTSLVMFFSAVILFFLTVRDRVRNDTSSLRFHNFIK